MIQRTQTLWLLLAAIAGGLSFSFPFVVGQQLIENNPVQIVVDAGSNMFLLLLTSLVMLLSVVTIFLFKNRKKQSWIAVLGIILSSLLLVLYILEMQKLVHPVLALTSLFPLLTIAGFIMAWVGIRRDENLVKSSDSLR
jgi:magnesium-transporting ATPase (P-type)